MFPDAGVSAALIVGGVALVSNWRTQRAATAAILAAQHGPMTDRWVSAVKLLASAGDGRPADRASRHGLARST